MQAAAHALGPPLVYGPGVQANFLRLLRLAESGLPLPFGGIRNRRSLISVWNLCDLIACLVDHPRASAQTSTPEAPRPTRLEEGRPSLTAQSTARLRGAHQLLDQPRILDDPLALRVPVFKESAGMLDLLQPVAG